MARMMGYHFVDVVIKTVTSNLLAFSILIHLSLSGSSPVKKAGQGEVQVATQLRQSLFKSQQVTEGFISMAHKELNPD